MAPRESRWWGTQCATSGVGSLPHRDVAAALALSFSCDVPYLPELPALGPQEGLLAGGEADPESLAAWGPFLEAVRVRRPAVAKVQVGGPVTVASCTKSPNGALALDIHEARERITTHLEARVRAQAGAIRQAGATPLVVVDEPALSGGLHLPLLARVLAAAREAGALVGVHCCGQGPWAELLSLELDLLSFDARLSLGAIFGQAAPVRRFLERGGRLAPGVIPTEPGASFEVPRLCASVVEELRAHGLDPGRVLARSLLTPACGLAGHTVGGAVEIFEALGEAQRLLRQVR